MSQNRNPASDKTEFHDLDQFPNGHITVGDYTRTLGGISGLMPYDHLSRNPWAELAELQAWLKDQPRTMGTFQFRDLPDDSETNWDKINRNATLTHILGGWVSHYANQRPRWVNPYYLHIDAVEWTPVYDKWEFYQEIAGYGLFRARDLADWYNLTHQSVTERFERHRQTYSEARDEGRRRMANTVECATAWTEWTVRDCANALDMHRPTLHDWIRKYADVDVPPKPSSHDRASVWGWPGSQ